MFPPKPPPTSGSVLSGIGVPKSEYPGVPPGVTLRAPGDHNALRKATFDNALKAASELQPVSNSQYTMKLSDVHYADPDRVSKKRYKEAILKGETLGRRLRGTWQLIDNATQQLVSAHKSTIAEVPYITDNGTAVLNGVDYSVAHQTRLKPGVFARIKSSGEAEAHVNLLPGTGQAHRMILEPGKGTFRLHFDTTSVPLISVLKAMQVPEKDIKATFGDLYPSNVKIDNPANVAKLAAKIVRRPDPSKTTSEQLKEALGNMRLDPDVSNRSLGAPFDHVSPDFYMAAAKRVLAVNKGGEQDDRDALYNQVVLGPEDLIAERIKNARGDLFKMLFRATLKKSLDHVPSGVLTPRVHSAIMGSGLGNPLEEVNSLELLDQATRITRMGQGGIPSSDSIPMESRAVHPTQYGFIDPIRTPENLNAGVDMRLANGVMKGSDGRLYAKFKDSRTGEVVYRSPQDLADKTVAFHGDMDNLKNGIIRAIHGNQLKYVPRQNVDYHVIDNDNTFNQLSNLILAKSANANQRVAMGSRMLTQAMPLSNPEAPLVRPGPSFDGSPFAKEAFSKILGENVGAIRAKKAGTVQSVKDGVIQVLNDDGTTDEHDLFQWHPLNRKSFIHQEATVRPGQRFGQGDLLARSNNTDAEGNVAPGTNLRAAYVVRDGNNFEDAASISESAAKRLASDHMYQHGIEWDDNHIRGKRGFLGAYATKYPKAQLDLMDDDGVIKPGTIVQTGQPLVLAARKRDPKYGKVLKGHEQATEDSTQTWDRSNEGVVTDVVKTKNGVSIAVRSKMPVEVSDKISGLFGDKSIVSEVIPDHMMPHDKDGKPYEVLFNPLGIITRGNAAQVVEAVLGKIAEKTGKPYTIADWSKNRHWMKMAIEEARKHGIPTKEDITDPRTGKSIPGVLTGNRYVLRLHHIGEDKIQARGTGGGYDQDDQPVGGKHGGAKRLSLAELYAVISHGAYGVVKDKALRSTRRSDWWSRYMAGMDVPEPKVPLAFNKFLASLQASGINPIRKDNRINLMAMTDKGVDELAENREISSPETVDWNNNLKPVPGGLFDEGLTGAHNGNRWAKITLPHPIPNPVMEEPIKKVLGITGKEMDFIIGGLKEYKNFGTGAEAIGKALGAIDIDDAIDQARADIGKRRGSGRDAAVKRLKYLKSAQNMGLHPRDWMLSKVPVIPPVFRPVDVMSDTGRPLVADANYLYRDLLFAKQAYEGLNGKVGDLSNERTSIYNAVKAVMGLGDPINPKNAAIGIKGHLRKVLGAGPKYSMVQRKLLSSPVNMVSRSVISPDPDLGLDEVGIPEDSAWGAYEPIVVRQLSRRGMIPFRAMEAVKSRTDAAKTELLKAMAAHPVIMSRAPVHHKYGVMAFWPKLAKGNSIRMNAFVTKGFGADYDGDQVNIQVPVLEEGVRDAIEKMLPSKNLVHPRNFSTHYKPINEFAGGLYEASTAKSEDRERFFHTMADAIAAFKRNEIKLGTPVAIGQ